MGNCTPFHPSTLPLFTSQDLPTGNRNSWLSGNKPALLLWFSEIQEQGQSWKFRIVLVVHLWEETYWLRFTSSLRTEQESGQSSKTKWSTISVDRKSICLLLISRIFNKNNQTPCAVLLWEENNPQCSNNSNTSGVRWYSGRILYGDTNAGPQRNQRWSTNGGKVLVTIKATMLLSWEDTVAGIGRRSCRNPFPKLDLPFICIFEIMLRSQQNMWQHLNCRFDGNPCLEIVWLLFFTFLWIVER